MKLTPMQTARLLTDLSNGMTKVDVAAKYGVSIRTVYRIIKLPRYENGRSEKKKKLKPCGTDAAYRRHKYNGEYPCSRCLKAHAQDVKDRKEARDKARSSDLARRQRGEVSDLSA